MAKSQHAFRPIWIWLTLLISFCIVIIAVISDILFPAFISNIHSQQVSVFVDWSSLLVALVTLFFALFHYSFHRNSAVLIIGVTVICLALMEGYFHNQIIHKKIIDADTVNSVHFSWAIMRFCSASLLGIATVSLLWGPRSARINQDEVIPDKSYRVINTIIIVLILVTLTIVCSKVIHLVDNLYIAYLNNVDRVVNDNTWTVGYLVAGSILFFGMGTFFSYVWYRANQRAINFGLLLSFVPQVMAQIYFFFNIHAINELHFLGVQGLVCFSYCIIAISIANDKSIAINRQSDKELQKNQNDAFLQGNFYDDESSENIAANEITQESGVLINQNISFQDPITRTFDIGSAKRPLGLQIPIAAFILAAIVAGFVGYGFYTQSVDVEKEREVNELRIESKLLEYLVIQLFETAKNDIAIIRESSNLQNIIEMETEEVEIEEKTEAKTETETEKEKSLSLESLQKLLTAMLGNNQNYDAIEILETTNNPNYATRLIKVRQNTRNKSDISTDDERIIPIESPIYSNLNRTEKTVLFSPIKIALKTALKTTTDEVNGQSAILSATLPIFNTRTQQHFGAIVIHINFSHFITSIVQEEVLGVNLLIGNKTGDVIFRSLPIIDKHNQPDNKDNNIYRAVTINELFPQYESLINRGVSHRELIIAASQYKNNVPSLDYFNLSENAVTYYRQVELDNFSSDAGIVLLMQHEKSLTDQQRVSFRNRSILMGIMLALVALLLAVFASFKISLPLRKMAQAVQSYHKNGVMQDLPVDSKDEIGVLARSFNNLLVSMEDITEAQKYSSQEAKESSDKLSAIVNSAADAIITINEVGDIQSFNVAAEKMFCYQESEVIGESINMLMPKSFAEKHDHYLRQYLLTGVSGIIGVGRELKGVKQNGEEFPMHLAISEVVTNSGRFFTGIVRDISLQKNAEIEKTESLALLEATLESTDNGIMVADNQGNLLRVNSRFTHIWNIPEKLYEEGNEKKLMNHAVHMVKDPDKLVRIMKSIFENPEKETNDILELKDGRVLERTSRQMKLAGNRNGRVWSFRDITLKKQAENSLIESKQAAENAAKYKSEFLASMSHEIRTPMNGVLGLLNLMLKGQLKPEQRHYAELANSSAESLLAIVNDILDFSKVEAGRLDLEILEFDIIDMFDDFTKTMAYRAREKNIEFVLDTSEITANKVKGDPGRIRQILTNLVGNAFKFTESGEVIISAAIETVSDYHQKLTCSVTDTGVGIPQEKIEAIFESFTQVDASTTRVYGGTGLGLAIVKQLCELMGGAIKAESTPGVGSCFKFTVLLDSIDDGLSEKEKFKALSTQYTLFNGVRMMIIEKNRAVSHLISKQMTRWGAECIELSSVDDVASLLEFNQEQYASLQEGNELHKYESAQASNQNFDAIFVDESCFINQSSFDDSENNKLENFYQTIHRYDSCKATKLFLLRDLNKGDDDSSPQSNSELPTRYNAILKKPLTKKDYLFCQDVIIKGSYRDHYDYKTYLATGELDRIDDSEESQNETDLQQYFKEALSQKRLLLVEDNYVNQHVAIGMLEDIGLSCDIAGNGKEAMSALIDCPQNARYDAVLMDCQMPEMDGFEATQRIRRGECGEHYCGIPIVAMTANAMKGDRERCIDAGMTDYVSKPIDHHRLEKVVIKVLTNKTINNLSIVDNNAKTNDYCELNIDDETETVSEDESSIEKISVWDRDSALQRVRGKRERLEKLIAMFQSDMPERIDNLKVAIEEDKLDDAADVAHTIKGVVGNLSAEKLMMVACDIELASKDKNRQSLMQLVPVFDHHYQDVCNRFEDFLNKI